VILLDGERYGEEDTMAAIDAGAEDVVADGDVLKVLTDAGALSDVRAALDGAGVEVTSAELAMEPSNEVDVSEQEAPALMRLIDALEEHDDVESVHSNFNVPDEVLERVASA
jgi:transcriptional/translational regulatory protein YebC/TACO1